LNGNVMTPTGLDIGDMLSDAFLSAAGDQDYAFY
jgi:hypothetical protein